MLPNPWTVAYLFSKARKPQLETYFQIFKDLEGGKMHPLLQEQLRMLGAGRISDIEQSFIRSIQSGYQLIYPGHPFYPLHFLTLEQVPYLLRMQGSPIWLAKPGLAVVGHREPSLLSLQWMSQELGAFLKNQSCFTVSGGARGVDQRVHSISLLEQVPTVALMPAGMNKIYPDKFKEWILPIINGGGAILSEYEDDQPMLKHHFLQRNRLISCLAEATVVIEARRRSGTLLTAKQAIEQSRPVWVMPGHPIEIRHQGSMDLIAEGATPVRDAQDLCILFSCEAHAFSLRQEADSISRRYGQRSY